jgi:hypothetical protein
VAAAARTGQARRQRRLGAHKNERHAVRQRQGDDVVARHAAHARAAGGRRRGHARVARAHEDLGLGASRRRGREQARAARQRNCDRMLAAAAADHEHAPGVTA